MPENGSLPHPLDGIRVLDFTRHLLGRGRRASSRRWARRSYGSSGRTRRPLDFLRLSGPHADGRPGMNRGGFFAQVNVGKKSIAIDMSTDEGAGYRARAGATLRRGRGELLAGGDGALGLDYEGARALRSDVIYLSASGFGQTGPYAGYRSVGPTAQPTAD